MPKRCTSSRLRFCLAMGALPSSDNISWNRITRDNNLPNFTGSGAYVTLRRLIKGFNYSYTKTDGGIATPDPGNMELCLQYNYTSLSDASAGIYGGYLNDWALCYNYYSNI